MVEKDMLKKNMIKQLVKQARELFTNGQSNEALDIVNKAINIEPESAIAAQAYCMRAKILTSKMKLKKAKIDIKKAIILNRYYKESFHLHAEVRVKLLNDQKCLDIAGYDEILRLCLGDNNDDEFLPFCKIGDMLRNAKEYKKAKKYYNKALEKINEYFIEDVFKDIRCGILLRRGLTFLCQVLVNYIFKNSVKWNWGEEYILNYRRSILLCRGLMNYTIKKIKTANKDFKKSEVPEWFGTIIPILQIEINHAIREGYPVRFADPEDQSMGIEQAAIIISDKKTNGTIIFGGVLSERAYDAKTREFIWMS